MKSGSFSGYRAALSGTGADIGGERDDPPPPNWPTRPGFYWARWMTAARDTHEGDELTPGRDWEVVEVWRNQSEMYECEGDDPAERFGVGVPGVRETQWLDNFQWDINPRTGRPEPIPEPGCEP